MSKVQIFLIPTWEGGMILTWIRELLTLVGHLALVVGFYKSSKAEMAE
ncbi:hypothetical protein [Natranaerobius thermophilus]|uniref:Uncharacterized protein n=1 Tax=Natranaerobius thermophilus (strain ATCC BAA-1301 / DSM 18059 / JW/NM-WN-LF) TaxID=457570 RepID=B2A110_NATTJ|nr:hypothetical protein [Natranaerobius thermophilus]ACB84633.1 hypothetical protein Nther_1049 [Natranaerobius thermophilus JW/NM-WN-LF]